MAHRAVAGEQKLTAITCADASMREDRRVWRVGDHGDLGRLNPSLDEPFGMGFVYRQNMIGQRCARPLFEAQQALAHRTTPAAKLVAIYLRHRIVNIQDDSGAKQ